MLIFPRFPHGFLSLDGKALDQNKKEVLLDLDQKKTVLWGVVRKSQRPKGGMEPLVVFLLDVHFAIAHACSYPPD